MTDEEYAELHQELSDSLAFATCRVIARYADQIIATKIAEQHAVSDPPAEPE